MARYVEVDELKATIKANDWSNPAVPNVVNMIIDRIPTADVAPRAEVAREVLAKVDDLAWRHKMRGRVSMDLFHDDIEELKQKYTEEQK